MSAAKTEIQDINQTRKRVSVNVTGAEISAVQTQLIKEFQREARIQGFRPGKAPENLVRMRYAKELKSELSKRVISNAYQEGVTKSDLQVFSVVEADNGDISPDVDVTLHFTVDVIEEFELPDYSTFKVTVEPTEATEKEVDEMIRQILSQRAEFKPVEKVIEEGDYVKCSYEGKIGDEFIADILPEAPIWGTQKMTWEEAGSENTYSVKAVVEGLVGMKAGDEKEVTMDFPDDFIQEKLAGKSAVYSLKVDEVREKILPEINEEFLSGLQMKDEAELREKIGENIENKKKMQMADVERKQITEQLLKSVDFPIPESGIESESMAMLSELMQRRAQGGATQDELEAARDELKEEASTIARDRLKTRLILSKIAEKETIKVSQEDFGQLIMLEAQQTGQSPEKIAKELQKDSNRINVLRNEILRHKALNHVVEKAEREVVESKPEA